MKKFPDNFYFGASTSSHQVEGGCLNDWSEWEKRNAGRLAKESLKYSTLPSWKKFQNDASSPDNYISGLAADHYARYNEDFDIAKKIGLNAYRFSIEWSRIEPMRGVWDPDQFNHYSKVIASLRERNIEPFLTIWHWTLPLWLEELGGVSCPEFPELFARYASKLAEEFSMNVKFFITINEPEIYSLNSYLRGIWPPEKKGIRSYRLAMNSLVESHKLAYDEIKKRIPGSVIGPACNMTYFEPGKGFINKIAVSISDRLWNRGFIEQVKSKIDFIGVNYYFHNRIKYGLNKNDNQSVSDLGWELYPQGIETVLKNLKEYNLPIYVTENGLADADDKMRAWFIEVSLRSIMRAIESGADVRGYLHWSLMDNFEWDKGFWPRFGLIAVDRKDLSRKIRIESCDRYREIIEKGI
jgi:beta-glucosidase